METCLAPPAGTAYFGLRGPSPPQPHLPLRPATRSSPPPMRALLLEPDDATREQLRHVLAERGWRVVLAGSAAEALERCREQSFPLVVLGFTRMEGTVLSFCRDVRACIGEERTLLVVVPPPQRPAVLRRLSWAGADDFLLRPLSLPRLIRRISFAEGWLSRPAGDPPLPDEPPGQDALYHALFDQSPVGVFFCDRELRITHCNHRLTEIVGAPYPEIVGTSLLDLRDERLLPGLSLALGGEEAFYEGPYRTLLTGRQIWISVHYAPLRAADGTVIGGTGVLEDISRREQAQQQLLAQAAELERVNAALRERTLELESALRARSRLYSTLNHELRTPISAIMLYEELLLGGTLGPLGSEQREALERSHTASRHLLELVQEVLDLAKLEAGGVSFHPVEVRLPTLLGDLRDTVIPLAQRYGSHIHLEIRPEHPPLVTDPQRVRQILLNLLSNAAKFGRGRPILVRCRTTGVGETAIEVVDQGIGIAEEDLPRVFEDFVQIGSQQEGGTGLGLAISRRLAELLGGRLEVESRLGEGSVFRLVLPPASGTHDPTAGEREGRE